MKKFLVLYLTPPTVLEEWSQTDLETRKASEEKMQSEWQQWTRDHQGVIKETSGAGKTKLVTKEGVSEIKNDIMLYSIVEAESHEAAAKIFENHPHLQIPQSSIEIMPANTLPGMEGFQ